MIADGLDSILATDYPADRREILVIDNGSSDGTAALIQARPVTYLREAKRGVSNARNRGIAESRGEIVAFVDADCLVEPQWLTELVRPFEDPAVGSVGGDLQHAPPITAAERQAARMLGNWQRFAFTSNPAYPITANAAYRRDVLDRIGPFDTHMTRAQDVELGLRLPGAQRSPLRTPRTPPLATATAPLSSVSSASSSAGHGGPGRRQLEAWAATR
jgi:cellulose synthase/poly-beta-1,6-N-acetylglucosamine synthase-like glycosyltransferase